VTETVKRSSAAEVAVEFRHGPISALPSHATVGAGLGAMLASGVRGLRATAQRGELDRPETIHRFRVGLRRLRSLFSAFRDVLPDADRRVLGTRLAAIAKRYSRVREWDVFIAGTLTPMSAALPHEPALLELESCARAARQRALPEPTDFPAEAAETANAIESAAWLHRPSPELAEKWNRDLKDFAVDLLAKRHRRLRKRLKDVDLTDHASFHQVRIYAKKVRYPIEMFSDLFETAEVDDYLRRLIAVQDALGQLNDSLIARDLVAELPLSSRPQGLVNGWLARDIESRRRSFPAAAKACRKAAPFWEG